MQYRSRAWRVFAATTLAFTMFASGAAGGGRELTARLVENARRITGYVHAPDEDEDIDDDEDGIADRREQILAERFAPIVYHSTDDTNLPTNVDDFLTQTSLNFYDDGCSPDLVRRWTTSPTQADLLGKSEAPSCGSSLAARSDGTRSEKKQRTFFLADVPSGVRAGSADTRKWTTYFHAYPNDVGGVTIQYWRFYAYNDAANDHGGDWEGMQVVLDASDRVHLVRLLGHSGIEELAPPRLTWEGDHVRVFSEGGGHATHASGREILAAGCGWNCRVDPDDPRSFVRQESWSRGHVSWPDKKNGESGSLVNLGSRRRPLNGQLFVRYSGLWGSPGNFYITSGYWGPAYNETGMRADGFLTAWCAGMAGAASATSGAPSRELRDECYPASRSR